MELREYAKKINEYAKKYPKLRVIYASDSEGNHFEEVHFSPSICVFKDGEFADFKEELERGAVYPNAICVN